MITKWIEKYCPTNLDEMCLDESLKKMFQAYLDKGDVPNMLLAGKAGIGKTTLAKMLAHSFKNNIVIFISASEDNGIDIIKRKVREVVDMCAFDGGLKIVILDEADGLSRNVGGNGSSAQDALRNIMESDLEDTRFILTCNSKNRIIPAIQSRNPVIDIKYDLKQVVKRIFYILKCENIKLTKDHQESIVKLIQKKFPDIRQIIGIMENCCVTGKFIETAISNDEGINSIIGYIERNIKNPRKCREYWIQNSIIFGSDYFDLGAAFFNMFDGTDADNLLKLGEKYYQLNHVADTEIGFYNMVLVASKFEMV